MPQDQRTLVHSSFDVINKNDMAGLKKSLDPKFHAVFADVAQQAHAAFPDMKITVEDTITEGDKVVTRWTMTGTHKGQGHYAKMGAVKPTGKHVKISGITIHQIKNGVIVNSWGVTEKLEALEQLGLVSEYAKHVVVHP